MADTKVYSDGNVDVLVIRQNQLTDPTAPAASELNANGVNVSLALAWDGTTWPTNSESNDTDDRSIKDRGNATTRGYAQYEGELSFFHPKSVADTTSDFGKAYQFFKDASDRIPVYLVTRLVQTTPYQVDSFAGGDLVSVFKFGTDAFITDTEGEDSYKYTITFNAQGGVWPYTQVVGASKNAITVTPAGSLTGAVGSKLVLRAVLNGKRVTNQVTWTSSAPQFATVSLNGVVTRVASGTADITASHPSGTTSTAVSVVTS